MLRSRQARKITILGDYPPRKCGIATFTSDLLHAITAAQPSWKCSVVAVTDPNSHYEYPAEVRFEIAENDVQAYLRAADFLNLSHADVLCVQHEFGIFGGPAGSHLIALLRRSRIPVVTTLHTILANPTVEQRKVFDQVLSLSSRLAVMTQRGREMLRDIYSVPEEKIAVIPHGIPDMPFVDPNFYKDQFGVEGRPVLLTFGLLSPGKGIEFAIQALPEVVAQFPDVVYIVLGATHPNLVREQGETYRLELERMAKDLGVEKNVMFVNRFVEQQELLEYIGAADIYITPYLNEAQITSGTLAYCFGAGKNVVSTPYWHAAELLAEERGVLVEFRNSKAIAQAVIDLLSNESKRHLMRKQAYLLGREMVWSQVGHAYCRLFEEARGSYMRTGGRSVTLATLSDTQSALPEWRFDHLLRMTDSTGIFQHAVFSVPWFEHGYCTDDNARALLLTVMLERLKQPASGLQSVQFAAAAFLQHAFRDDTGRFRNFMSFDRRWLEEEGSEDSHGRALWALGAVVGRTSRSSLRAWAASLFEKALPVVETFRSPRAWAFSILGLQEYLRIFEGDLLANRSRISLSEKLLDLYRKNSAPDWMWFENVVSYDNPRVPQALIQVGRWMEHAEMLRTGLDSLRWLIKSQSSERGFFRPVGSNGFWKRGQKPARFDQQPLEATATVSACIEAFHATGDPQWKKDARWAFSWFLGSNDLGLALYDATSGGCYDGLHENRVNLNLGAESTLSFLIALAEMTEMRDADASFGPDEPPASTNK